MIPPDDIDDIEEESLHRRKARVVGFLRRQKKLPPASLQRLADALAATEQIEPFDAVEALRPSPGPTLTQHIETAVKREAKVLKRALSFHSHAERLRSPGRPRERHASSRRSRAAPADDGGSEPPPVAAQRPMPLGLVELLLDLRGVPCWVVGDGALLIASQCPRCSRSAAGAWFTALGAACASGCVNHDILDALLGSER